MPEPLAPLRFDLSRQSRFSFVCRVCGRCCRSKVIMVGPHEVLGMARILGISTTEFLARHAENGGTALRATEDGRCEFVGSEGCRVHSRRPLVCRLYPLGRKTNPDGGEEFAHYASEPGCQAGRGENGTVADFLESQGAAPYFEWSRRYGDLFRRMVGIMEALGPDSLPAEGVAVPSAGDAGSASRLFSTWQDIDASLAEYCSRMGISVPAEIEDAIDLHIRALDEWLDGIANGN
jgi:Fe-S-cluster containining protein